MSFEEALAAARQLATDYTQLNATIRGMAVAEDHDPHWSAADSAKLDARYAQQEALAQQLRAALSQIERDHHDAWLAFLSASVERLRILTQQHHRSWTVGEYEHDQWLKWSQGRAPDQVAEIFARGLSTLEENRATIEAALRVC